jgi:signal peptidase II
MTSSGRAKRGALLVGITGAVIVLDQSAKSWAQQSLVAGVPRHILGPTYFLLTYNKGAAFSLGSGASSLIETVAVVLAVAVLWLSGRLAKGGTNLAAIAGFGLVSGGALSNLADRFVRHHHGAVVDFIQLVSWWPIFNVADAAITVGAVTIAVTLVFFSATERPRPSEARTAPHGEPADGAL